MASEIRVNQIQNRSGLGTVTFTDTGAVLSGIVTVTGNLKGPSEVDATTVTATTITGTTVKVGTAVTISAGVVTATSFSGDGSGLSGIDASSLKSGGVVKVQANSSGSVTTGVATVTDKISVGDSFIQNGAVGLGTTTQSDVLSGVGTAVGLIHFIPEVGLQVYSGAQFGWRTIANTVGQEGIASGGFIDGAPGGDGKKYHVFTSTSTLNVVGGALPGANIFVVAGGGSGGVSVNGNGGGGGGAGGIAYYPNVDIPPGNHTVTVGGGGAGVNSPNQGNTGNDSSFSISPNPAYVLAKGGGSGTGFGRASGADGGSGGGGAPGWHVGTGTQPSQNSSKPSVLNYGNPGGTGNAAPGSIGGGGGAGTAGSGGTGSGSGWPGGDGQPFSFLPGTLPALAPMPSAYKTATGPTGLHGGGGGAGAYSGSPGAGGPGGGGAGGGGGSSGGAAGVQYTGGGAGGGQGAQSGNGGDGLVIIFYPE